MMTAYIGRGKISTACFIGLSLMQGELAVAYLSPGEGVIADCDIVGDQRRSCRVCEIVVI